MSNYVGKSMKRVEDPRFLQGKASYVANLSLPGMVHVAVKRSPHAHAIINSIDTSAAAALDGVVAVYTGQDLLDSGVGPLPCGFTPPDIKTPAHNSLAVDKVRHVGDGVAAVVAESPYIAADALELIEVSYEPLPAVVDARGTTEDGAPLVHDDVPDNVSFRWPLGLAEETAQALADADHVIELDFVNQRLIPNAMEPRACVAEWNEFTESHDRVDRPVRIPHTIRLLMGAFTLAIPEHKLRVISPDVGGGFGRQDLPLSRRGDSPVGVT